MAICLEKFFSRQFCLANFFSVGCHILFYILWMVRDAVLAQESATILGDEYIVLDTDTTEVLVGLNLVEVEELCAVT